MYSNNTGVGSEIDERNRAKPSNKMAWPPGYAVCFPETRVDEIGDFNIVLGGPEGLLDG